MGDVLTRLADLEAEIGVKDSEIEARDAEIADLTSRIERLENETLRDIAINRGKIVALETQVALIKSSVGISTGKKTEARIEAIKAFLKLRGGSATFSDVRAELKMKPDQFSKLVRMLNKNEFDVKRRPRSEKEKILILRQRIGRRVEDD